MFLDRLSLFACSLAGFAAKLITAPSIRHKRRPQLRDLPPELIDDIALPQNLRERLLHDGNQQQRSLTSLFRR